MDNGQSSFCIKGEDDEDLEFIVFNTNERINVSHVIIRRNNCETDAFDKMKVGEINKF